MNRFNLIFYFLLFFPMSALAAETCVFTNEYRDAQRQARSMVYGSENSYSQCRNSVFQKQYWEAMYLCELAGDGKNNGGGCTHLVGYGKYLDQLEEPDFNHCEIFKFEATPELVTQTIEVIVDLNNIAKCKD